MNQRHIMMELNQCNVKKQQMALCLFYLSKQENTFLEPHKKAIKTPLKQQSSTSHSLLGGIRPDMGAMTTPTKLHEMPVGEPWTPTANLKMLISAASPEIRSREKKREDEDHTSEAVENLQVS